ncbi:MAG TPA: type II toxin-antitoxin system VapC family toxin [Xanthobacteraceae bacterium]|nr:type II toxin-antitoxin system VapC family toxin [Xanthobacteraceae bacterium]
MASAVLDSSAVLAILNAEPGADLVIATLDDALLSTVNYAEVVTKIVERGGTYKEAEAALQLITATVIDFDLALAQRTGALRAETRKRGLSLGDRACLSLAEREGVPAITGDRSWVGAVSSVEVRLFR